jgi:uncharacterized protein
MNTITSNNEQLKAFCKKNHIKKLSLFGSYLKNLQKENSDIDLLVEFKEGHTPGFLYLSRMENDLSQILNGKKVDLKTYNELSRYFRDDILEMAVTQYDEQ